MEQRERPTSSRSPPITDAKGRPASSALRLTHHLHRAQPVVGLNTTTHAFLIHTKVRQKSASISPGVLNSSFLHIFLGEKKTAALSHTSAPGTTRPGLGGSWELGQPRSAAGSLPEHGQRSNTTPWGAPTASTRESPAPNCGGALRTGYSEQSRAWFP